MWPLVAPFSIWGLVGSTVDFTFGVSSDENKLDPAILLWASHLWSRPVHFSLLYPSQQHNYILFLFLQHQYQFKNKHKYCKMAPWVKGSLSRRQLISTTPLIATPTPWFPTDTHTHSKLIKCKKWLTFFSGKQTVRFIQWDETIYSSIISYP